MGLKRGMSEVGVVDGPEGCEGMAGAGLCRWSVPFAGGGLGEG